ncbi:MAG: amidohydrolase family protein [Candidatus Limnocylindria bacterium]
MVARRSDPGDAPMRTYTEPAVLARKLIRPGRGTTLVLDGGTLIDGTGRPAITDAVVVIADGRIAAAGSRATTKVPTGAGVRAIATGGRYIMPGLIDCHVHLTGDHVQIAGDFGRRRFTQTTQERKYMEPIHATRVLRAAASATALLAAGVTTVRNLGHGDTAHIAAVQAAVRDGTLPGPNILTAGWAISQTGGHGRLAMWPYALVEQLRPRSSFADGPAECARHVERNIAEGADCIKIYTTEGVIYAPDRLEGIPNFSIREIRAMTEAAHRQGKRVAAHTTGIEGTRNALIGGVDTIEHGPHELDEGILELMREKDAVLDPTLGVFDQAAKGHFDHVYPRWVGERARRWMRGRAAMIRAARDLGITISMGTDSGPPPRGGRNAAELEALVEAGLTPLEALSAGTRGGAIALGIEHEVGTIAVGMRADVLVLRADPVADIRSLQDHDSIERIIQACS